jgi:hypothetical protein
MTDWWLIAFGVCFALAFFSGWGGNRMWAWIWLIGAIGCVVAGANNVSFPADTTGGVLSIALALFVWASPFIVIGFLIWVAIKVFAGAVASEVVRKQSGKQ